MRSITTKLIIAFLGVSLVSIIMVSGLARWNTREEFNDFVFDRNRSEMVTVLANYFRMQGSWEGVHSATTMHSIALFSDKREQRRVLRKYPPVSGISKTEAH